MVVGLKARVLWVLGLACACGASRRTVDDGGNEAGAGAVGGASAARGGTSAGIGGGARGGVGGSEAGGVGGRAGAGGRGGVGGDGVGGSSAGDGSAGRPPSDVCQLAPQISSCEPSVGFFYHDPTTNQCLRSGGFTCADGPNHFATLAECLTTCPRSTPGLATCDRASDCTIWSGCCGYCNNVSAADLTAVNVSHANDPVPCPSTCGECPDVPELETTVGNFVAECSFGNCVVYDLTNNHELKGCTSDSDCSLRDGAGCCQECDGRGLISIATASGTLLCPDGPEACSPCVHDYGPYEPRCIDDMCRVDVAAGGAAGASGAAGAGGA